MTAEEWEDFQAWRSSRDADDEGDDSDDGAEEETDTEDADQDDADDEGDDDDVITYRGARYRREDAAKSRQATGARDRAPRTRPARKNARTSSSAGKPRVKRPAAGAPVADPAPGGDAPKRRLFT